MQMILKELDLNAGFKSSANLKSIYVKVSQNFYQILILEYMTYNVLVNQDILVKQQRQYYQGQ